MPNVPNVPGVPTLASYGSAAATLLVADAVGALAGTFFPQWGLFSGSTPVVVADNVASFDYKQSWNVANYPLEGGAFESYDKVATPFDVRLRFSVGGSQDDREALLRSVEAIADKLALLDAVTPEKTYVGVNVTTYDYRRSAHAGVGLLLVDVHCVQVRVTAGQAFSSTKAPAGASPVNGGTVQATPASRVQQGFSDLGRVQ